MGNCCCYGVDANSYKTLSDRIYIADVNNILLNMTKWLQNETAQGVCISALQGCLLRDPNKCSTLLKANGLIQICAALDRWPVSFDIVSHSTSLLRFLFHSSTASISAFIHLDGINRLCAIMDNNRGYQNIQHNCVVAIGIIVASTSLYRAHVLQCGAIDRMYTAVDAFQLNEDIQSTTVTTLMHMVNLSRDDVVMYQGIYRVKRAMRMHPDVDTVQVHGVVFLRRMSN
jgi:hypothetical protein